MTRRRSSNADRCPRCQINYRLCFCNLISKMESETRISIIMHAREAQLLNNTARLANHLLTNSEIKIRGEHEKILSLEDLLLPNYRHLYLFPDESAVEVNEEFVLKNPGPYQIILPDGSWRQAYKMKKREAVLSKIPSIKLASGGPPSAYHLRREPNFESVCTIEAIARVLGVLESKELQKHLESALSIMVERVLKARTGNQK